MARYSGNTKLCLTCAYWSGTRKAVDFGWAAKTKEFTTGTCTHRKRWGTKSNEKFACYLWEKWPPLR